MAHNPMLTHNPFAENAEVRTHTMEPRNPFSQNLTHESSHNGASNPFCFQNPFRFKTLGHGIITFTHNATQNIPELS